MDGQGQRIVYGNETLCNLNQISEPIKEIIFKILNFNNELLDVSKHLSLSEDVCAEIEKIGQILVALAGKFREKLSGESCVHGKLQCAEKKTDTTNYMPLSFCDETSECDELHKLKENLTVEQETNDKIQSQIDELRLIQEERLTRLEEHVKQGYIITKYQLFLDPWNIKATTRN